MNKIILWDIDGTLLNFKESEKAALKSCFTLHKLGACTDEMITRYSSINRKYWERLERGELQKQEVLVGRFRDFFKQEGLPVSIAEAFNAEYQKRLGDTICFYDDGYEVVKELKGTVRQYAVTNGTLTAQKRKLERSGLNELLDGAFISDEIGIEKPNIGFFDTVFQAVGECRKEDVFIVGDSLTSDMTGGNNAGIRCVWYRPGDGSEETGAEGIVKNITETVGGRTINIDYKIRDLHQVKEIVFGE